MKRRIIAIAAAMMLFAAPAMSQVFILEDDEWNNKRTGSDSPNQWVPEQNVTYDQSVPAGEGIFVLAGLAGAYLLGKRKKEEK
ncbi:MAG: hypothetical protein Q4F82_10140 [bacterium]|nr:hypothetical protein [bacterium]